MAKAASEEDIGLLVAAAETGGGDNHDHERGVRIHGDALDAPVDAPANAPSQSPSPAPSSLLSPRRQTSGPRTPQRVRFDLRPTTIDDVGTNRPANGHAARPPPTADHYHHARESFDLDHVDPMALDDGREGLTRLLTDMEAPSVTMANSRWGSRRHGDDEDEDGTDAWLEAEQARPKSGLRMAFMNMANSIIGAGIIGQPYAFRQAGLLTGTVLLVALTFVVDWTICLIVINSKLSGANSFQGTVEHCFGRPGLVAISVAQWAFAFGGMVAFGVIVGDSIPHVLVAVWPGLRDMPILGLLADRRIVIVVFVVGVSFPLTLYRDIAKLARASTLALISMAVILVTVLVQGALTPREDRGSLGGWRLLIINDGVFQAIGVISFAFVCHHNSLLIYGSLKTPTIDRFSRVTHYSTGISMFACLAMALAGFLTFGDRTLGNVLNNFAPDNTMVNIARLCFGLNMLTTFPLEAFVCREVMLNYYWPRAPFRLRLHLVLSTALVVAATAISLTTCDLGVVFELVGSTSASAMAYILPPLCYIKLSSRSWRTYLAYAVAVFGCVVMGISVLQAVVKMATGDTGTAKCM